MIVYGKSGQVGELALSLKPPKWLRNAATTVARAVGIQASVPTPAGPVVLDSRNPQTIQDVKDAITRTQITVGTRQPPGPGDLIQSQLPGGYATLAIAGIGLLALVSVMGARGRGR